MVQEKYCFTHIKGLLLFIGHPIIRPHQFLGLTPGDKITQVGLTKPKCSPGMGALNRTDIFTPYITYVGTRIEPDMDNGNFLMMFEVRKEDYPIVLPPEEGYYIAYQVLYGKAQGKNPGKFELKVYDHSVPAARIYQPHFEMYNEKETL